MSINEIFSNPTVKTVLFQIRFPNLFYMESKIGDIQLDIMERFPGSGLILQKQFLIVNAGTSVKTEDIEKASPSEQGQKIWQFQSPDKDYQLNITTSSLDITSQLHKTYNNESSDNKFRDIIEFVLNSFFKLTKIPIINRIGLRYIDECPIIEKTNTSFQSYYHTTFPLSRFSMEDATEMSFRTVVKRGEHSIIYNEYLKKVEDTYKLILDFDGFATNISFDKCLETTDNLHDIITDEYEQTIGEPVYKYMRGET